MLFSVYSVLVQYNIYLYRYLLGPSHCLKEIDGLAKVKKISLFPDEASYCVQYLSRLSPPLPLQTERDGLRKIKGKNDVQFLTIEARVLCKNIYLYDPPAAETRDGLGINKEMEFPLSLELDTSNIFIVDGVLIRLLFNLGGPKASVTSGRQCLQAIYIEEQDIEICTIT